MVLFFIAERNTLSTVTGPLTQVLNVVDVKDLKEYVVFLMIKTYPELCNNLKQTSSLLPHPSIPR